MSPFLGTVFELTLEYWDKIDAVLIDYVDPDGRLSNSKVCELWDALVTYPGNFVSFVVFSVVDSLDLPNS